MIHNRNLAPTARIREVALDPRVGAGSQALFVQNTTTTVPLWPIGRKLKIRRISVSCTTAPAGGALAIFVDNVDKSEGATDVLTSSFNAEDLVADITSDLSLLSTVEGGEVFRVVEPGDFLKARWVADNVAVTQQIVDARMVIEYEYVDDIAGDYAV